MKKFKSIAAASVLGCSLILSSCGTSKGVAQFVSLGTAVAGEVAAASGYTKTGAALSAGAGALGTALVEITPEDEYYIGRAVAATVLGNYTAYENPAQELYLNKICNAIVINSDNPELFNGYHVKILDSQEVNAFATSGGHIFVTRGMIAYTGSEDELAAVIAHEIGHIHLKHSLMAIKASRYTNLVTTSALAAASTTSSEETANLVGDIFTTMVNNGYSQTQEFQADSKALSLMADAGYNPEAMKSLLTKMNEKTQHNGFYKTHPSPGLRITNLNNNVYGKLKLPPDTCADRVERFNAVMR